MERVRIGQVVQKTGLSASTLRYYEREGLVSVAHDGTGRRLYDARDVSWIRFFQRLRAASMPIGLTRRYVQLRKAGPSTLRERLELLCDYEANARSRIAELSTHTDALDAKIALYRRWIDDAEGSGQTHIPDIHGRENDGREYRQEPDRRR